MKDTMDRRQFVKAAGMSAGAAWLAGCRAPELLGVCAPDGGGSYSVAVLGDTHFDAEPASVYHSHYIESNRHSDAHRAEFRRNGEMWRERCRRLLASSARLAHEQKTRFVLQLGDLIQGDCDDVPTHRKMLEDAVRTLRSPYPENTPFFMVMGNHDFRGKGAREAYLKFAEPFLSCETGAVAKYPAFAFRQGRDLWVFCDFETPDLAPICDLIDADPGARRVFLVTHGPFTTFECAKSFRWRLGGRKECEASRPRLYETLSRRHAVVLSGHTHSTNFYRHENEFGGFSEFTSSSVWSKPALATAEPVQDRASEYGKLGLGRVADDRREDLERELGFFRPGLREYFFNRGAGHYRLDVSDAAVTMSFYPGDALEPARTFRLA